MAALNEIRDTRPFLRMLSDVRVEMRAEIARQRAGGSGGPTSVRQLEAMVRELDDVEKQIISGRLPIGSRVQLQCAYFVCDSWPFDNPLGAKICELSTLYRGLAIP
jgi:hypothetical protein